MALLRDLLIGQKHTVAQATAEVLKSKNYPDKNEKSVKRIARNLARKMRKQKEYKNLHWPSTQINTGYMKRIDVLLRKGKQTTREIAEQVAKEFDGKTKAHMDGPNPESAKKVVRARLKRLRDGGEKFDILLEKNNPRRPRKEPKAKTPIAKKIAKAGKKSVKKAAKKAPAKKVKAPVSQPNGKQPEPAPEPAPVTEPGTPIATETV